MQKLLSKVASWMKPGAIFFCHTFCHKTIAYHFEVRHSPLVIPSAAGLRRTQHSGCSAVTNSWCSGTALVLTTGREQHAKRLGIHSENRMTT